MCEIMEYLTGILVMVVMVIVLFLLVVYKREEKMSVLKRNGIPGPKPSLWMGNLREHFSLPNVEWDWEMVKRYGPVCGYYFGAKPVILVTDPSLVEIIQKKENKHFLDRPRRVPGGINPDPKRKLMLGNLPVEGWKATRKILDKAFSPKHLKSMMPEVKELVRIFISRVESKSANGPVNFYELTQNLTLDLIGRTGFGINSDIQNNPNDALKAAVEQEFSKSTSSYLLKLYLCLPELRKPFQVFRVNWEHFKNWLGIGIRSELWDLGNDTVQTRLEEARQEGNSVEHQSADLLSTMLQSHKMSKGAIVANSVLFFEAGFETMSAGLAFMIHLLMYNPDSQRKIRDEIASILKEPHDLITMDLLKTGFSYLDAVINESLRMYPPQTTFISRSGDIDLPHSYTWEGETKTCTIPKGVQVQIGLYQILNDPNIWESPRTFNPERFLKEDVNPEKERLKRITFQPFGESRRICIGRKYADMVLKLSLIKLFSKYIIHPDTEATGEIEVVYKTATMTPKHGVYGIVEECPLFPEEK